ncbi:hypothetical protein G6011_10422 [Alternaria panax]|uniref:Uncharacterized protein n=1 Tax=Alternaria panax TaxID=48097 RepID=A0AAD4IBL3_9PLEO|nr:hypothetical protein G6011_10422 [Alternaria panax]
MSAFYHRRHTGFKSLRTFYYDDKVLPGSRLPLAADAVLNVAEPQLSFRFVDPADPPTKLFGPGLSKSMFAAYSASLILGKKYWRYAMINGRQSGEHALARPEYASEWQAPCLSPRKTPVH